MAEVKNVEKKKTNPLIFVGIGCLVLIVLISLGSAIIGKMVASKIAGGMLGKAIENKTGIKTNIEDLEKGKMTFTDNKTGTSVDVGSGKMPDNFPKDFPIYAGARVTSSLTGGEDQNGTGFWLTLSTPDLLDQVTAFYKTAFDNAGWTVTANYPSGGTQTQAVKKGTISGTVSLVRENDATETQIVIVLSQEAQ